MVCVCSMWRAYVYEQMLQLYPDKSLQKNNVILLLYSRVLFSMYIKSQSHLLKISRNFESLNCLLKFQRIIFFIFIVSRKIMAWTRYSNVARVATDETDTVV